MSDCKIFISGSRKISRLSKPIVDRIAAICDRDHAVIVGDANGVDKAVQTLLSALGHSNVTVFHTGNAIRNNVGNWNHISIAPPHAKRDFAYFAAKDEAMCQRATHGFVIWDGKSRGSLRNIESLAKQSKPTVVSFQGAFHEIRNPEDVVMLESATGKTTSSVKDRANLFT